MQSLYVRAVDTAFDKAEHKMRNDNVENVSDE